MQGGTEKQRKRHLRIFEKKVRRQTTTWLKKVLDDLWDVWTWDDCSEFLYLKIQIVDREITERQGAEYNWKEAHDRLQKVKMAATKRKQRKLKRDGNAAYFLRTRVRN